MFTPYTSEFPLGSPHPISPLNEMFESLERIKSHFEKEKYAEAIAIANKALQTTLKDENPLNSRKEVLFLKATSHACLNQWEEAASAAFQGLKISESKQNTLRFAQIHFEATKHFDDRYRQNLFTKNPNLSLDKPLFHAFAVEKVKQENLDAIALYIQQKKTADAICTISRETLLMQASRSNKSLTIVKYLIALGADPNKRNQYEDTPVIIGAENGAYRVVSYLLNSGVGSAQIENLFGQTPLELAKKGGHQKAVAVIRKHLQTQPRAIRKPIQPLLTRGLLGDVHPNHVIRKHSLPSTRPKLGGMET